MNVAVRRRDSVKSPATVPYWNKDEPDEPKARVRNLSFGIRSTLLAVVSVVQGQAWSSSRSVFLYIRIFNRPLFMLKISMPVNLMK